MPRPSIDLTGQRFNRLTAIERISTDATRKHVFWLCRCDDNNLVTARSDHLQSGRIGSCGCLNIQHGHARRNARSPAYHSWYAMMQRCYNKNHKHFKYYGGRGIAVCERWHSFENFLADMWERPNGRTLERIDNDRSYEPGNCVWASRKEQANNRRPRS